MKKNAKNSFFSKITARGYSGFSLVELLVVIGIISILATIGLVIYQGVQVKARDAIRKSDLNNMAIALEIYAQQHNGKYIADIISCPTDEATFNNKIKGYMSEGKAPHDPKDKSLYCYISPTDGLTFTLCAKLETTSDPDANNPESAACTDFNYGIEPK